MKDTEVIESMNNAWRALARRYQKSPDGAVRNAMNMLSGIINEVDRAVKDSNRVQQITIDEWIEMLKED